MGDRERKRERESKKEGGRQREKERERVRKREGDRERNREREKVRKRERGSIFKRKGGCLGTF